MHENMKGRRIMSSGLCDSLIFLFFGGGGGQHQKARSFRLQEIKRENANKPQIIIPSHFSVSFIASLDL